MSSKWLDIIKLSITFPPPVGLETHNPRLRRSVPYPLGHRGYIGPLFIIQVINVMKITGNISTISYRYCI